MGLRRFLDDRATDWAELERLVVRAGRRPESLGADGVRRLGELYRASAADLAYGRRRFPADPSVARLEVLVPRARHLVYASRPRRFRLRALLAGPYWALLRSRPVPLLLAAALLFVPAALAFTWALVSPDDAGGLVPAAYRAVVEPRPDVGRDLPVATNAALATEIFTNNISVAIIAFAGGVTLGIGTIAVLVGNGVQLGAVAGLAWGAGNGMTLLELVAPHGVLELTCIVVAGAAGLRVGWAIVEGGPRPRGTAVREEALAAVQIVLGTACFLVVAGLVEGFVTPRGIGVVPAVVLGLALAAPYWALLGLAGRARGAPAP